LKFPPTSKPGIYQSLDSYCYASVLSYSMSVDGISHVLSVPCATENGVLYTKSDFVILACFQKVFAKICDVIVIRHSILCVGKCLELCIFIATLMDMSLNWLEKSLLSNRKICMFRGQWFSISKRRVINSWFVLQACQMWMKYFSIGICLNCICGSIE